MSYHAQQCKTIKTVCENEDEYSILGTVSRTIVSRDQDIVLGLHKSLVRPHLDYVHIV